MKKRKVEGWLAIIASVFLLYSIFTFFLGTHDLIEVALSEYMAEEQPTDNDIQTFRIYTNIFFGLYSFLFLCISVAGIRIGQKILNKKTMDKIVPHSVVLIIFGLLSIIQVQLFSVFLYILSGIIGLARKKKLSEGAQIHKNNTANLNGSSQYNSELNQTTIAKEEKRKNLASFMYIRESETGERKVFVSKIELGPSLESNKNSNTDNVHLFGNLKTYLAPIVLFYLQRGDTLMAINGNRNIGDFVYEVARENNLKIKEGGYKDRGIKYCHYTHLETELANRKVKSDVVSSAETIKDNKVEESLLKKLEINQEKLEIYKEITSSTRNFFITGKAGTGKSTLLKYIRDSLRKKAIVVSPTGVASLIVGGSTIHSAFQIAPQLYDSSKQFKTSVSKAKKKVLKEIDILIIDEVSMVRVDLMHAISNRLKQVRGSTSPFGGVQVIMFGDLYQLPPVVVGDNEKAYLNEKYGGEFFFMHDEVKDNILVRELKEVFRQKDSEYKDILNHIRDGQPNLQHIDSLNKRVIDNYSEINREEMIALTSTNKSADSINSKRLDSLPGDTEVFNGQYSGKLSKSHKYPALVELELKVGARVMLLVNNQQAGYVNGSIGVIRKFLEDLIEVEIDKRIIRISPHKWEEIEYKYDSDTRKIEKNVVGTFTQYPLKLAWAMTIHKSQGQTINSKVIVDLSEGAFESGQAYVALSRVTSLELLFLESELEISDFIVNKKVRNFMNNNSSG